MVIEWKERDHEEVDVAVERDVRVQKDLQRCGLYKCFSIKGIRSQAWLI
jgi:hypothetical protein